MGNCSSPLRRHMRHDNVEGVRRVCQEAGEGSPDVINEDFTADCILDSCQQNQNTVLHSALSARQMRILEILLQYGGDPNTPSRYFGQTPFHQACRQNNVTAAVMLVKYGADVNLTDGIGRLPLHCAASSLTGLYHKNISCLRYIVEDLGKADQINAKDDDGNTPLHKATKIGHLQSVEFLLQNGADINITNAEGKSPLDVTNAKFRNEIGKIELS